MIFWLVIKVFWKESWRRKKSSLQWSTVPSSALSSLFRGPPIPSALFYESQNVLMMIPTVLLCLWRVSAAPLGMLKSKYLDIMYEHLPVSHIISR